MEKEKGLKLFGVRIEAATVAAATAMENEEEEVMRKSQSMGNLCAANQSSAADHGYLSDGGLAQNSRSRARQERKRGIPWTEEEHRTFLAGLEKLGKGDWRGISRNFVTTRTPTQVASHAQKYFLRQINPNKKKRRSSLFDVGINDNATLPPTATPIQSSPMIIDTVADRTASHLMNAHSHVSAPMVTRIAEASLPLTLAANFIATPTLQNVNLLGVSTRDQVNSRFYGTPATLSVAPDFLQLSLPNYVPVVHESVAAPLVESNELELSIAPPQPHPLAKLPPQHASGAIRVI